RSAGPPWRRSTVAGGLAAGSALCAGRCRTVTGQLAGTSSPSRAKMRLSDLYQTDEAFEARREQRCGHCGELITRWDGTRYAARLVRIRPDCGHSHYVAGGPQLA